MTRSATPAVSAVAAAHGVNLDAVTGTGVGGRITVGDVRTAAGLPRNWIPAVSPSAG